MHDQHKSSNEVNPSAAAVVAEDAPPARQHGRSARKQCGEDGKGTPSSNTVPSNCNLNFKPLRYGIDSLYLSYTGKLAEDWDRKLSDLKELAQSENEAEQAQAQVSIGAHLFEVRDKGVPRFAYVLADNCFFIKLNRKSKKLPVAHVQISSEYLSAVGVEAAEKDLRFVLNTLGTIQGEARVSRADLHADFVCGLDLDFIEQPHWVTRANLMAKYYDARLEYPFTGWVVGIGGGIQARLYEKVVEIVFKSHKDYLFELWKAAGWQMGEKVWRLEFQISRPILKELNVHTLDDLLKHQAALWQYLTQDWLRLSIPNPNDKTRSRWPNHPLWDALSGVYFRELDQPRLTRFRPQRLPQDERLFVHGLGGLTSFMASKGIEDLGEGWGEYMVHSKEHFTLKGESIEGYVLRKVKAKARKFNTLDNRVEIDAQEAEKGAEAYRQAKDGY
ncbi:MAG: hypothetical protein AB7U30_05930 [Sulfuricellaceae bacterium]|jgi:hypothetical protein